MPHASQCKACSDNDGLFRRSLGRREADTLLLAIPDSVVLSEERVTQDPQRHSSIDALDAHLALLLAIRILDTDDIEVRAECEVVATHGDADLGQALGVGAVRGHVADLGEQGVHRVWRSGEDAGAGVNDHVATKKRIARLGALTANLDVLGGNEPIRQEVARSSHRNILEVAVVKAGVSTSQGQRRASLATRREVEGKDVVLDLALGHQLIHRHGNLVDSSCSDTHAQDAVEGSSAEDVLRFLCHLCELKACDRQATDGGGVLADEAVAAASAVLEGKTAAILLV
mmetsp:Transcript_35964/g.54214  ORF Transcript_35964/g.54214 Transcript_35964/m.54214 type:complete len:286 (-) Transcript_35964:292-1149(-)